MFNILSILIFSLSFTQFLPSQDPPPQNQSESHSIINDQLLAENQSITAQGEKILYDVHGGSIKVKSKDSNETANIHFIAYFVKSSKEKAKRPLAFCFNGGPGSSSVWLHMGFLGPKTIITPIEPSTGGPTYKDNPLSLLSACDLVFIDPVATGFSKTEDAKKARTFLGIEEDLFSIADFIQLFLTKFQRWQSPKLLIGESYGTARAVGLTHILQDTYFLHIDGLILISLALDLQTFNRNHSQDLAQTLYLPTYSAIAQYHKKLRNSHAELSVNDLSENVSSFAVEHYAPALFSGSQISEKSKAATAEALSEITSLPNTFFLRNNLRMSPSEFREKLLEDASLVIGTFDGRMSTWNPPKESSICKFSPHEPIDPSLSCVASAFTCALNEYLVKDLKLSKEDPYLILNLAANANWNWDSCTTQPGFGYTSFLQDFRMAFAKNPQLKVFVAAGYYDLATPFFAQQYSLNHLFLPESLSKNITFKTYKSGHMIYLDEEAKAPFASDLSLFIKTMPQK